MCQRKRRARHQGHRPLAMLRCWGYAIFLTLVVSETPRLSHPSGCNVQWFRNGTVATRMMPEEDFLVHSRSSRRGLSCLTGESLEDRTGTREHKQTRLFDDQLAGRCTRREARNTRGHGCRSPTAPSDIQCRNSPATPTVRRPSSSQLTSQGRTMNEGGLLGLR